MFVHLMIETNRHCGHAEILRELIDGSAGHRPVHNTMGEGNAAAHVECLEAVARSLPRLTL